MNGGDVRRRREQLGWTRPELLRRLQNASTVPMTIGRLAGIEVRCDELVGPEVLGFATALGLSTEPAAIAVDGDGEVELPAVEPPPIDPLKTTAFSWVKEGEVVLFEWNGLKPGERFKVEGCPRATFAFTYYFKSETQEYITCHGGKAGHDITRSFTPDRIRTLRGRRFE